MTAAGDGAPSLLTAEAARIAIDDAIAIERLDLSVAGPRLLLVGDAAALIGVITGVARPGPDGASFDAAPEARVVSGALRLLGRDVAALEHVALMAAAPLDVPVPPGWTVLEYVQTAMRLGGVGSARDAAARAGRALDETGLGAAGRRALRSLSLPERRALHFAAALARDVRVVVADEPLAGLDGPAAAFVLAAIGAATAGRQAILSARAPVPGSPEGSLAEHASDLVVLAGGEVAFAGEPSSIPTGARLWGLTVRANGVALAEELERRGIALRGGPLRFAATLPGGASTREIVAAAVAVRAPVVELVPLW